MSDDSFPHYSATYRNTPLFIIGGLAIFVTAIGAAYAAVNFLPASDLLWPAVEIAALSILAIVVLSFAARSQRTWRAGEDGLQVKESSVFSFFVGGRDLVVPYREVTALRRVDSGLDAIFELQVATGGTYRLMQGFARNASGLLLPDTERFHTFGNALRARISASAENPASFMDGLGFWNKFAGLLILGILLALTLGLSGLILYGVFSGAGMPQGAAMQGLAFVLLLPFGVGYVLYSSWARRKFVLSLGALRDQIKSKH